MKLIAVSIFTSITMQAYARKLQVYTMAPKNKNDPSFDYFSKCSGFHMSCRLEKMTTRRKTSAFVPASH